MKPRGQFIMIKGMIQNEAIIDLKYKMTTKQQQQRQ